MDPRYYQAYVELQDHHWWFQARAQIICDLIAAWHLAPPGGRILDIGCGPPGPVFDQLSQSYQIEGMDPAPQVARMARTAGLPNIRQGRVEEYAGPKVCLALLLDVIEHVEDDAALLRAARQTLAPGGCLLVTVPALQFLWSGHDELAHHRRRYGKAQVERLLNEAGLIREKATYFNSLLFPLAVVKKLTDRMRTGEGRYGYHDSPPKWLNDLFRRVFSAEAGWLRHHSFPIGVSILGVGRNPP